MAYSVKALADRWDCSQRHIYKLIDSGRLRSFSIGSSRKGTRISDEEVVRWETGGAAKVRDTAIMERGNDAHD